MFLSRSVILASVILCACLGARAGAAEVSGPGPLLARSDEQYVLETHRRLLGRTPRAQERNAALIDLRKAPHRIIVQNRILDSAEFRRRVGDAAFLAGLFEQVNGRPPQTHEMLLGLHALRDEVPRSELFGALLNRDSLSMKRTPGPARLYRDLLLNFRPRRLRGYERQARAYAALTPEKLRTRLDEEADRLGGAQPGPPEPLASEPAKPEDPPYNTYYGYIHAHTRVSLDALVQGSPGPFEAFRYARDVAGLDFLGLSDHSEFISTWPWRDEWSLLQRAVDANNQDGVFVALRGFEYSNPIYGHLNVFGTPVFTSAWTALTLRQFYAWLALYPDAATTFNHPGAYDFLRVEFMHFRFFPDVMHQLVGIELLTHNAEYSRYSVGYVTQDGLGYLDEANHAGWRIASVSAQDNHAGGWGTIDEYRTAVLASALTQEDVLEALRQRRFYSTQDKNLVMSVRADGREMGSVLGPGGKTFAVTLDDGDGEGFASIDLYANGSLVEHRDIGGAGIWEFTVAAPEALTYYYVLVTQADADQAMSASIWVEGLAGLLP